MSRNRCSDRWLLGQRLDRYRAERSDLLCTALYLSFLLHQLIYILKPIHPYFIHRYIRGMSYFLTIQQQRQKIQKSKALVSYVLRLSISAYYYYRPLNPFIKYSSININNPFTKYLVLISKQSLARAIIFPHEITSLIKLI